MNPDRTSNPFTRRRFLQAAGYGSLGIGLSGLAQARQSIAGPPPMGIKDVPNPIRVGILSSLSGSMAISEQSVVDVTLMAIEEINQSGGVLGREVSARVEDGESDWPTFREKAVKLIREDQVATVFGCWTSASRKSVLEAFESNDHLLWYPVSYEGQECSRNIIYTGPLPNQQIEPSIDWIRSRFPKKPIFLLGSDYVYPRTINTIIKEKLYRTPSLIRGEDYIPLGDVEVEASIRKIQTRMPKGGVIYNSLNGDTAVAFFKKMAAAGLSPQKYPVVAVNIEQEEVFAIGTDYMEGHYAAWSYFQSVNTAANRKFVQSVRTTFGEKRVVNDPMEAAYTSVYLWKQAVEKAGTADDIPAVRSAAIGQSFEAPGGRVTISPNHHLNKRCRIGQVQADGQFKIVHETGPIAPQPWNQQVRETKGLACDWSDPKRGRKYKV
jgi:urea transport system substrate-binding protein